MGKPSAPLAAMLARKQISAEQYQSALRWLQADAEARARCQAALGAEGAALLGLVLARGQSSIEIAAARVRRAARIERPDLLGPALAGVSRPGGRGAIQA